MMFITTLKGISRISDRMLSSKQQEQVEISDKQTKKIREWCKTTSKFYGERERRFLLRPKYLSSRN
jgi:hypothetical protein